MLVRQRPQEPREVAAIEGGTACVTSDEWSWRAAEGKLDNYDGHVIILHLNGIGRRITDAHGHVVEDVLA